MKKYCIVSFCNLYYTPYVNTYIEEVHKSGNSVSLLFWDRDATNDDKDNYPECAKYVYQRELTNTSGIREKLLGYIEATRFFNNHLETHNYAGVILLQTHVAVACASKLINHYKNRYLVDIRDYTLENHTIYRIIENSVIKHSYASIVSSPAYNRFLPKNDYVLAHNYIQYSSEIVNEIQQITALDSEPIKITFVGKVRFIDKDKKLLLLFANDSRFRIGYYGAGSEVLEAFCRKEGITNVDFCGSFHPERTVDFYKKTNIINNLYGNHDPYLDYALSNKLYYAVQFHIPILVCPDTYMQEISIKYKIGYVFDINAKNAPDELYTWYRNLDRLALAEGADLFLDDIRRDTNNFLETIRSFVHLGDEE